MYIQDYSWIHIQDYEEMSKLQINDCFQKLCINYWVRCVEIKVGKLSDISQGELAREGGREREGDRSL